jgi:thiol-disulfide isomerase/thioredoxin
LVKPDAVARFSLNYVFQLQPSTDVVAGDCPECNVKEVRISYSRVLPSVPTKLNAEIVEECCGDKFDLTISEINERGFKARLQRTDKNEGWGQFLKLRWTTEPLVHELPTIAIDNIPMGSTNEKHVLRFRDYGDHGEINSAQLLNFFDQFFAQTLPLLIRSQPVQVFPVPQRKPGTVVDVVGDTFEQIVLDEERDVLLVIYSPFCGASIAVAPIFEQVAAGVADSPGIVIARIDKTANDLPIRNILVTHYPMTYLFPAGKHTDPDYHPLDFGDYNGSKTPHNRDVPHSHFEKEGIINFVRQHGKTKLK